MFTMVASRTTISCARPMTARTSQRRRCSLVCSPCPVSGGSIVVVVMGTPSMDSVVPASAGARRLSAPLRLSAEVEMEE